MLYDRDSVHVEYEGKSDISNNSSNCNHLKSTQTIPEQSTMKARNQGTGKKNSHIGRCTHTLESTNVRVQNIFYVRNNVTCSTNCRCNTDSTLYTLETWIVSGT